MSVYFKIRNWVDAKIADTDQSRSYIVLPIFAFLTPVIFFGRDLLTISASVFLVAGWSGFLAWRHWRHLKSVSIKADRHFDRVGKFDLSEEYHSSQSATGARRTSND